LFLFLKGFLHRLQLGLVPLLLYFHNPLRLVLLARQLCFHPFAVGFDCGEGRLTLLFKLGLEFFDLPGGALFLSPKSFLHRLQFNLVPFLLHLYNPLRLVLFARQFLFGESALLRHLLAHHFPFTGHDYLQVAVFCLGCFQFLLECLSLPLYPVDVAFFEIFEFLASGLKRTDQSIFVRHLLPEAVHLAQGVLHFIEAFCLHIPDLAQLRFQLLPEILHIFSLFDDIMQPGIGRLHVGALQHAPANLIAHGTGVDALDQIKVINGLAEVLVDMPGIDGLHDRFNGPVVLRGGNPQHRSIKPLEIIEKTGKRRVCYAGIHDHDLGPQLREDLEAIVAGVTGVNSEVTGQLRGRFRQKVRVLVNNQYFNAIFCHIHSPVCVLMITD